MSQQYWNIGNKTTDSMQYAFFEIVMDGYNCNICVGTCNLGDEAIKHLIKSDWPKITLISLFNNYISLDGCQILYLNNWRNNQIQYLETQPICGCNYLALNIQKIGNKYLYDGYLLAKIYKMLLTRQADAN